MKKKVPGISCLFLLTLGFLLVLHFQEARDSNLVGTYINGEYSNIVPSKNDGYIAEKIVCDNETVGVWDEENWGLQVTNLTKKSKCNVYFRTNQVNNIIKDLDTRGKCPSVNSDGSVNVTSAESENSLLCSAPDNYGTSYYYRGNVTNNYVYFAGFYWRIVRINGDGTIRVIYDGTVAHANGEASEDRIIGYSTFNEKSDDNAYVGYMYGTPNSSTYAETHANINDSKIKKYVDGWYENNIKGLSEEKYIVDELFNVDKGFLDGYNSNGYSTTTYYNLATNDYDQITSFFNNISLKYNRKNDNFSVNDSDISCGVLKYPIALLSKNEAALAGGFWQLNDYSGKNLKYYLYNGLYWWFLSPDSYRDSTAYITYMNIRGVITDSFGHSYDSNGVKPVINLKPQAIMYGNGKMDNPYRLTSKIK